MKYYRDHPSQRLTHEHRSGAFSLGMLGAVVKGGESAKRILASNKHLSDKEVEELQRSIWNANSAKAQMEEIKVKTGYYDMPSAEKVKEIESFNFDEMLKGEVTIDVYYESWCSACKAKAHQIWNLVQPVGFKVNYLVVDGLPPPTKDWVLQEWPHILLNGHEVSIRRLDELILNTKYLRALEARKRSEKPENQLKREAGETTNNP
jgi:thiol-disulfide isomerase/thioredoxin